VHLDQNLQIDAPFIQTHKVSLLIIRKMRLEE